MTSPVLQKALEALKLTISAQIAPDEWQLDVFETAIEKCRVVLPLLEAAIQQQPEPVADSENPFNAATIGVWAQAARGLIQHWKRTGPTPAGAQWCSDAVRIMEFAGEIIEAAAATGAAPSRSDAGIPASPDGAPAPERHPVAYLHHDSWGTLKLAQTMPPPDSAFAVYASPPSLQQQKVPSDDWPAVILMARAWFEGNPDAALTELEHRAERASPSPTEQQEGARDSGGGEEPEEGKR